MFHTLTPQGQQVKALRRGKNKGAGPGCPETGPCRS